MVLFTVPLLTFPKENTHLFTKDNGFQGFPVKNPTRRKFYTVGLQTFKETIVLLFS
ncbi:hypothetical protein LX92_02730 [Maribacter polysiphoniae]|uniref:Uncharacterized protein n=1 Tax=Maribacter polysiphoniae TaxID=429344 RepID=A0A316E1Z0_9FLAO|nr:hypothetical protein LX92_02730 [Maribacter polysiphoniae]